MPAVFCCPRRLLAVSALLLASAPVHIVTQAHGLQDAGTQSELQSITIETGRSKASGFTLVGRDAGQQLLVTGKFAGGKLRDLTRQVQYQVAPAGAVAIDASG